MIGLQDEDIKNIDKAINILDDVRNKIANEISEVLRDGDISDDLDADILDAVSENMVREGYFNIKISTEESTINNITNVGTSSIHSIYNSSYEFEDIIPIIRYSVSEKKATDVAKPVDADHVYSILKEYKIINDDNIKYFNDDDEIENIIFHDFVEKVQMNLEEKYHPSIMFLLGWTKSLISNKVIVFREKGTDRIVSMVVDKYPLPDKDDVTLSDIKEKVGSDKLDYILDKTIDEIGLKDEKYDKFQIFNITRLGLDGTGTRTDKARNEPSSNDKYVIFDFIKISNTVKEGKDAYRKLSSSDMKDIANYYILILQAAKYESLKSSGYLSLQEIKDGLYGEIDSMFSARAKTTRGRGRRGKHKAGRKVGGSGRRRQRSKR